MPRLRCSSWLQSFPIKDKGSGSYSPLVLLSKPVINWSTEHKKGTVSRDKVSLLVMWGPGGRVEGGRACLSKQANRPPEGQSGQVDLWPLWIPRGSSQEVNIGSTRSMSEHLRLRGCSPGWWMGEGGSTAGKALPRRHGVCACMWARVEMMTDRNVIHPLITAVPLPSFGAPTRTPPINMLGELLTHKVQTCTCPRSHKHMYRRKEENNKGG